MLLDWYEITPDQFDFYGMNAEYFRMDPEIAGAISAGMRPLAVFPAGGRVRFKTNADSICLKCDTEGVRYGIGFDLYRLENGQEIFLSALRAGTLITDGHFESRIESLPGTMTTYTLNFPTFGRVDHVEIGLTSGAELLPGDPYVNEKPVVYYGSSITQGAFASSPGMTYEAQISQRYNLHYVNLGFSGFAKGEPAMAEYVARMEMSAFVMDYDHNAYEPGSLEKTHQPFFRTVREKHPDLPILILTRPDYLNNAKNNDDRTALIRKTYEDARAAGDKNVAFLDGKTFYNGPSYHSCSRDGCHPNDLGFFRMAQKIGPVIASMLGLPERQHDEIEF